MDHRALMALTDEFGVKEVTKHLNVIASSTLKGSFDEIMHRSAMRRFGTECAQYFIQDETGVFIASFTNGRDACDYIADQGAEYKWHVYDMETGLPV